MSTPYLAPVDDMKFLMANVVGLDEVTALPGYGDATPDLVDAVLDEAAKLAQDVMAPLNKTGDEEGLAFENGVVRTPKGFKDAYDQYVAGGWGGITFDADYGGQGLPYLVGLAIAEIWDSANTSLALCPLLTAGAVEALEAHGTDELKKVYLPKLISGEWSGTMNLTEPQAGSDVGALRSKAWKDGDHYRIQGQKIFITWGEHDMVDNICHLVLARLPDAPGGTKGISLFLVPKFLPKEDGSLGERNDLRCVSIEHKLGIHASPTCVMSYGDNDGAIGYLIGKENDGMACMFTMMNAARLHVGVLGLGTAERAFQQAVAFAKDRVQSRPLDGGDGGPATIIHHPDVRRMLLSMKAKTEASRALALYMAAHLDKAHKAGDAGARKAAMAVVDILTPIVKAWCTDRGCEVTDTAIQVHGGMGFIEETGVAQHHRDARIHPIYEGTNGIQANDLMGRKVLRDGGTSVRAFIGSMREIDSKLAAANGTGAGDLAAVRAQLNAGLDALDAATDWVLETAPKNINTAFSSAVPYLGLFGDVTCGWLMARAALAAAEGLANGGGNTPFLEAKIKTARFFADHILSAAAGQLHMVTAGGTVMDLAEEQF